MRAIHPDEQVLGSRRSLGDRETAASSMARSGRRRLCSAGCSLVACGSFRWRPIQSRDPLLCPVSGWIEWWALQDSNLRPSACRADALPTELNAQPGRGIMPSRFGEASGNSIAADPQRSTGLAGGRAANHRQTVREFAVAAHRAHAADGATGNGSHADAGATRCRSRHADAQVDARLRNATSRSCASWCVPSIAKRGSGGTMPRAS